MIKENTKAPLFKIPSTNKNEYSLKDSLGKYVVVYFIQRMIHRVVQLKRMILINFFLNLKNLTVMSLVFQKTT